MPEKKTWLLVSFTSTTEALKAEKIFKDAGISGLLIPTPRSLSASCGLCWRSALNERAAVETRLAAHHLRAEAITEMMM